MEPGEYENDALMEYLERLSEEAERLNDHLNSPLYSTKSIEVVQKNIGVYKRFLSRSLGTKEFKNKITKEGKCEPTTKLQCAVRTFNALYSLDLGEENLSTRSDVREKLSELQEEECLFVSPMLLDRGSARYELNEMLEREERPEKSLLNRENYFDLLTDIYTREGYESKISSWVRDAIENNNLIRFEEDLKNMNLPGGLNPIGGILDFKGEPSLNILAGPMDPFEREIKFGISQKRGIKEISNIEKFKVVEKAEEDIVEEVFD